MGRRTSERPTIRHGGGSKSDARSCCRRAQGRQGHRLSAFNDKSNKQFHDRDLYVFCQDISDGKFTAHPKPALMGTDGRALKFRDDAIGQRVFDALQRTAEGSVATVEYNFPKPGTTEPVPKESYMTRGGDQGCGVGYYK